MRTPARNAARCKNAGKEIVGDTERVVDRGRVEVDVCDQPFALHHELRDSRADAKEVALTALAGHPFAHPAKDSGSWIPVLVDSVTETHDLRASRNGPIGA